MPEYGYDYVPGECLIPDPDDDPLQKNLPNPLTQDYPGQ